MSEIEPAEPVRARLVRAVLDCFLADDYHRVTPRLIAEQAGGQIAATVDTDILRMAFVRLAMTPMLLKDIFEEQMERPMAATFLEKLAAFNGRLFSAGLAPPTTA